MTKPPSGFRIPEAGVILRREVDAVATHGYAYERTVHYSKALHHHDRLTIAKPRGSSRVSFSFTAQDDDLKLEVSSGQILLFPAGTAHIQTATTVIWDVFALYPDDSVLPQTLRQLRRPARVCSSPLLDALFDRLLAASLQPRSHKPGALPEYAQALGGVLSSVE